jgi:pimeloyl-ACP methyl ester carboxylesterase
MNGTLFARGMNREMHSVPECKEKVDGVATIIDYQDGGEVQHATIQYLAQRKEFELEWLANLERSTVPATLIWGVDDPVAPTAVADFVWQEYLRDRGTSAEYWRLPDANHYLQNDRPDVIAHLMRKALGEDLDPVDASLSVRPEAVQ